MIHKWCTSRTHLVEIMTAWVDFQWNGTDQNEHAVL